MYNYKRNTDEILKNMKEENKIHENNLEQKIKEGTEKLKHTLKRMKTDMEKISGKQQKYQDSDRKGIENRENTNNTNTFNGTNNGKSGFYDPNYNNALQNDSALSSFHIHNVHNKLNKENKSGMGTYDRDRENRSVKYEKFNTLSTENMINSRDNFFKNGENTSITGSSKNNFRKIGIPRDNSIKNLSNLTNKNNTSDREIPNTGKSSRFNNYEGDNELDNLRQHNNSNNLDSPGKKSETNTNFGFTGPNFNSKGSLSLSESKNKEVDSDNEYSNYNLEKKILEQQNNIKDDIDETEKQNGEKNLYKRNDEENYDNYENYGNTTDLQQFSKSGTFKSQSDINNYSQNFNQNPKNSEHYGNYQNYYGNPNINQNTSYSKYSNSENNFYNHNNSIYSPDKNYDQNNSQSNQNTYTSNFTPVHKRNYSESISEDINSMRTGVYNNYNIGNYQNNDTQNLQNAASTRRKFSSKTNPDNNSNYEIKTLSNFNPNNSNLNDAAKKDLQEYLKDLESKNLIKLKKNNSNQWVLNFDDSIINIEDNPSLSIGMNKANLQDINKKYDIWGKNKAPYGKFKNSKEKIKNTKNLYNSYLTNKSKSKILENKNINDRLKINNEQQKYIKLKNDYENLKREKQSLEKKMRETSEFKIKENFGLNSNHNLTEQHAKEGSKNYNFIARATELNNLSTTNLHKDNTLYSTHKNNNHSTSNKKLTFHNYEDMKDYENEVLEKIRKNDLFGDIGYTQEDVLGNFIDKVIERSLYIYKNRNCHTCSRLLSTGKSTKQCPKKHHLFHK